MKKSILAMLAAAAIYLSVALLLPEACAYSFQAPLNVPAPAIFRLMTDTALTGRWWPEAGRERGTWTWEQGSYRVSQTFLNQVNLSGNRNGIGSTITISAASTGPGTSELSFTVQTAASTSIAWRPLQELSLMRQRREHARLMDTLTRIFGNPDRVYGFRIEHQKVKDATLLSLRRQFDHDPNPLEIAEMVDSVRHHILALGGRETNLPMLNVYRTEDGGIEAMIAIATDRELRADPPFSLKRMLPGGNILVAEVTGGPHRIRECQDAVDAYVKDFRMLSPAMPFQRMITERKPGSDTSKWVTTINYPVF